MAFVNKLWLLFLKLFTAAIDFLSQAIKTPICKPFSYSDASEDEFNTPNSISSTLNPTDELSLVPTEEIMDSSVSWERLPKDILDLILDRLVYIVDYLYFAAVCKEWYLVAQEYRKRRHSINAFHPHQLPLLWIPDEKLICSVIHGRVSNIKSNVNLNKRCFGSSLGWLMYLNQTSSIILLNPFSNKIIKLPPIRDKGVLLVDPLSKTVVIKKGVLSKDPELYPNDFMVAIIYGSLHQLAVYISSVRSWTHLIDHPRQSTFLDIIHHKGDFYAVDLQMGIGRIDVAGIGRCSSPHLRLVSVCVSARQTQLRLGLARRCYGLHLVSSSDGNLLLVKRIYTGDLYKKGSFTSKFTCLYVC